MTHTPETGPWQDRFAGQLLRDSLGFMAFSPLLVINVLHYNSVFLRLPGSTFIFTALMVI